MKIASGPAGDRPPATAVPIPKSDWPGNAIHELGWIRSIADHRAAEWMARTPLVHEFKFG